MTKQEIQTEADRYAFAIIDHDRGDGYGQTGEPKTILPYELGRIVRAMVRNGAQTAIAVRNGDESQANYHRDIRSYFRLPLSNYGLSADTLFAMGYGSITRL
jgi:hypothetical protein